MPLLLDAVLNALVVLLGLLFFTGGFVSSPGAPRLHAEMNQLGPWVAGLVALLLVRRWWTGSFTGTGLMRRLGALAEGACRTPRPLYGFIAIWTAVLITASIRRHFAFEDNGDLAIFDQALWNTIHGAFVRSTLVPSGSGEMSLFADHFDPLQLALTPVYLVHPSPLVLLVAQAVALALGALPLYWIARRRFPDSALLATIFPVLYLLYLPLRAANRYDYHPSVLAVPLLLLALYFLDRSRWTWMIVCLALAGLLKENLPIAGVVIGVYLLLVGRRRFLGIALAAAFGLWFYAGFAWIIPAFNPAGYAHFLDYPALAGARGSIVLAPLRLLAALLTDPERKLIHLVWVFGPVAFLPFLSPWRFLLGLPFLLQNLLSTAPHTTSLQTHHAAELIPFVFFAAVGGAANLLRWLDGRRFAFPRWDNTRALATLLLVSSLVFHGLPEMFHVRFYARTSQHERLDAVLRTIPAESSVSTWSKILPHVSHRRGLYRFPDLGASATPGAEFVVIDETLLPRTDVTAVRASLASLPARGYAKAVDQDGITVFRKLR